MKKILTIIGMSTAIVLAGCGAVHPIGDISSAQSAQSSQSAGTTEVTQTYAGDVSFSKVGQVGENDQWEIGSVNFFVPKDTAPTTETLMQTGEYVGNSFMLGSNPELADTGVFIGFYPGKDEASVKKIMKERWSSFNGEIGKTEKMTIGSFPAEKTTVDIAKQTGSPGGRTTFYTVSTGTEIIVVQFIAAANSENLEQLSTLQKMFEGLE